MTTIVIACGAVLVVTVLAVALFMLGRRSRNSADERFAAVAAQIDERMQAMVRDLSEALERAQEENRRNRVLGELGGTIDLDEVLTRTLEAAGSMDGVDAAVVTVGTEGTEPLVASVGLPAGDYPAATVSGPPDGKTPRSIEIEYHYGPAADAGDTGGAIRSALAVPLAAEGEQLGYLAAYSRRGPASFGEGAPTELEELALRAGPAIDNARRFKEARQLADLDALTALHNRRYFHETLAREVARAQRYNRNLALVVFDLDDFKAINDRIGHLAGDAVLAEAADRVREVVRSADVACRVGGDEFAVILPESTLKDADQLYRRLQHAVSARPVGQVGRLHLSAGVTELPAGRQRDDALRARRRGALPREGRREGHGGRGRDAGDVPARGARNGIQLVAAPRRPSAGGRGCNAPRRAPRSAALRPAVVGIRRAAWRSERTITARARSAEAGQRHLGREHLPRRAPATAQVPRTRDARAVARRRAAADGRTRLSDDLPRTQGVLHEHAGCTCAEPCPAASFSSHSLWRVSSPSRRERPSQSSPSAPLGIVAGKATGSISGFTANGRGHGRRPDVSRRTSTGR